MQHLNWTGLISTPEQIEQIRLLSISSQKKYLFRSLLLLVMSWLAMVMIAEYTATYLYYTGTAVKQWNLIRVLEWVNTKYYFTLFFRKRVHRYVHHFSSTFWRIIISSIQLQVSYLLHQRDFFKFLLCVWPFLFTRGKSLAYSRATFLFTRRKFLYF